MSRLVFDIETDGLLPDLTTCWILVAKDLSTGTREVWLPHKGEMGWVDAMSNADIVIGHNIIGFDLPALKKLYGFELPKKVRVIDTLIMSLALDYKRFGARGHSMEVWGDSLGFPKVVHEDWSKYSEDMRNRCITDVDLNIKIYGVVVKEFQRLSQKEPNISVYLRAEQAAAKWCALANEHGWPFDITAARELHARLEAEMNATRAKLMPLLGFKAKPKDKKNGEITIKKPVWIKSGAYAAHTADWFEINPLSGQDDDRVIEGEYCRVEILPLDLDSVEDVKIFLFRNGWVPDTWNYKKDADGRYLEDESGEKIKTSPKITEESLEFLEGNGKLYCDFLTMKSRFGVLTNWINNTDEHGNLHGDCFPIGTPSMRARHSIIVNVPSADSFLGKEMRSLFTTKPGWTLIGCDSAGNQARGLAHYLKDPEFTELLLHGDIHQYNADVLTKVLKSMKIDFTVPRASAKRILYAFLFGASGEKLWSYIFGVLDKENGKRLKNGFQKAVPGLKELIDKLSAIYGSTKSHGDGYIPGIAGNRIYVDSFHKLLVYLLQACEKATCAAAIMLTMEELEKRNIPYIPLIFMHDEEDFLVPDEYAEEAKLIGKQAFVDGPKLFGIEIMDGEAKSGHNWYEVH